MEHFGMSRPAPRLRLHCETLEAREVPASLLTESFDAVRAPEQIYDWQTWGNGLFYTSRLNPASGTNSLSTTGTTATSTRTWASAQLPVDAPVSVELLSDTPAPLIVFTRGLNLATPQGSFVGARIAAGGTRLDLISFANEQTQTLASLTVAAPVSGVWFDVTIKPSGTTLSVSLQRLDDGRHLTPQGSWQTAAGNALTTNVAAMTGVASVGLGRAQGGNGQAFFDDFHVEPVSAPEVVAPPVVVPAPPAVPTQTVSQSFDATAVNARPSDWQSWTSDRSAGFTASTSRKLSGANGLQNSGTSATAARSWYGITQPEAVQATAAVFADSLIPATLFVRGGSLDSVRPTYYGLSVVRGVEAKLVEVINGVETTLATLKSSSYVSGVWLRLSLTADGDRLRAVVSRQDTGQWLTPAGTWSDLPQPALEAMDSSIRGGGFVGLARTARVAGTVTFDDVEIRPAGSAQGPQLAVTTSQTGSTFRDEVIFRVAATAASSTVRHLEFRLDGKVRATRLGASSEWVLDTTLLANGPHELVIRALDDLGNPSVTTIRFATANANPTPTPERPELSRKLSHIRIAQLAYSGTPLGDYERSKLSSSVDLVIPNARFQQTIANASPDTQQLVYSNISNLYGSLLIDWLNFADRTGADREAAFYHVSKPTAWTGSSPSSQPVNQFWGVHRSGIGAATDLTAAARGGRTFGVDFGPTGSSLAIGYPEKFVELNVDLSKPATGAWRGVTEYVTAVDTAGNPTAWKTLTLSADATNQLTKSGRVSFTPPADWIAANIGGLDRLFAIRIRAVSGTQGQAPTAKTLLGRDYVAAAGGTKGTIPAFDAQADANGDGHLNDAEYAKRREGKDARFEYESRLFYPYYGQLRFVTNPSSNDVRKWTVDYHQRQLAANPLVDGLFLDNSNGRLPFGDSVVETTTEYSLDYAETVAAVLRGVGNKIVFANTAGGFASATPVAEAATGVLEEFVLRPTEANWAGFTDISELVKSRLAADAPSPYVILDSHPGSFATTDERVRTGALAYYYLLADSDRTMLMFFGGNQPSAAWKDTWITSAETDIGKSQGASTLFAQGKDPQNAALDYRVHGRTYEKALVLYKPRSYNQGQGTGTLDAATATTHNLSGNYRVLNSDGSVGPVVRSITLKNGEGVTLMKA